MMDRIELSEINSILDFLEERMLIVGQPKGVGLTTQILEYFCWRMFWEEKFSVIMLADDLKTKNQITDSIEIFFKEVFDIEVFFNYKTNVITVFDNFISVIVYKNNEISKLDKISKDFKFNYSYVDRDDTNDLLEYYLTEYLPNKSEKIIVSTYDVDESLFYLPEIENVKKVIVYSDLSKKNIYNLRSIPEYTLNYEKIVKGQFNGDHF